MIRNLTNVTQAAIELPDFHGISIGSGETIDGLMFGEPSLRESHDIATQLLAENLTLNDGLATYTNGTALDIIRGTPISATKYGIPRVASSDRPEGTYRYFTSIGDDVTNSIVGAGAALSYNVEPGQTQSVDIQFIRDTWIKDGQVFYHNAEFGSWLSLEVVVPPNLPFPAIDGNGNYDLVDGEYVANNTNTGLYWILPTEAIAYRFLNKFPLFNSGHGQGMISSPEPELLLKELKLRISCHNEGLIGNLKAMVLVGCYIPRTV